MRQLLALLTLTCAFAASFGLLVAGCSDAETPDAYFDAGTVDAGRRGLRDEPCLENACINNDVDICVQQNSGGDSSLICREICDTSFNDPCGLRRRCRPLDNGIGACLPANLEDESCPCDDTLACVNYTQPIPPMMGPDGGFTDGGQIIIRNVCKRECTVIADGGDTCTTGTCRLFMGSAVNGVCIE